MRVCLRFGLGRKGRGEDCEYPGAFGCFLSPEKETSKTCVNEVFLTTSELNLTRTGDKTRYLL